MFTNRPSDAVYSRQVELNVTLDSAQSDLVEVEYTVNVSIGVMTKFDEPRICTSGVFGLSDRVMCTDALLDWPKKFVSDNDTEYVTPKERTCEARKTRVWSSVVPNLFNRVCRAVVEEEVAPRLSVTLQCTLVHGLPPCPVDSEASIVTFEHDVMLLGTAITTPGCAADEGAVVLIV